MGPNIANLIPSNVVEVSGSAVKSKEATVAALIFAKEIRTIKPANNWQSFLATIRNGLRMRVGEGDGASLIPGMVLGDTSLQSAEFATAMRRAGLTHLTAVSGANFAIVSAFLLWLMQWPIRNIRIRLIITSLFLIAFIGLVRPSPSVLRAAAMAGVVIFAKFNRNRSDSMPALGFAIALVVICDPWQSRDPGFALSVLATAGLLLIAPKLKLPEIIATPIAATSLCAPIIIGLSGYLSFASIPANVLAAPLVAPITVLGFIAAIAPFLAPIVLPLAKFLASLITQIAWVASGFPVWQVANCDVGQGDALVVKVAKNQAAVFDVGPDPKLIKNCLNSLGINEVPFLLITHPHQDHMGGITGVPKIGKLITNARKGEQYRVGDLQVEILWPNYQLSVFEDLGEEGSAINNESIVARISSPYFSLLITGDIEPEAQRQIAPYISGVDIYKVAHHGSKYQDLEFTRKLNPKISIISVGQGNKYGHPNNSTLQLLSKSRVLRTDIAGGIAIDVTHNRISSSKVGAFGLPVLWRVT